MKQLEIIAELCEALGRIREIESAVLYGSFGRGNATPNSDIDIQLLVGESFSEKSFIKKLNELFADELLTVLHVSLKNRIVLYFKSSPKAEIQICKRFEDFNAHFKDFGSDDVERLVLFDKTVVREESLTQYLRNLTLDEHSKTLAGPDYVDALVTKFIYEFENCSTMHRRCDAFHSYFFYNAALHAGIQLKHLTLGGKEFNFLPRKMNSDVIPKEELSSFYQLRGTLFLPEVNRAKRRLLNFFYQAIKALVPSSEFVRIEHICETIFKRDQLWNFRSIQTYNPKVNAQLFRSSTLSLLSNELFEEIKEEYQLHTIIDLRAEREVQEFPYSEDALSDIAYHHIPFDPWNQPDWFKREFNQGSNELIAYRFFILACKSEIAAVMRVIMNARASSVLVHCHAGKDRTGIVCAILYLLTEVDLKTVQLDYLASESDTRMELLSVVIQEINAKGGIHEYLVSCGLSEEEIGKLKMRLIDG
jgi:protein tyrosine/serine phosphatase/predicted nucleotidyltransferase